MEKLELLTHVFAKLGLMALFVVIGSFLLYPLVSRWSWLDDPKQDDPADLFICDGCEIEYDVKGSCEYRTYNEDGDKQDYLICQGCYNEILDSWA